LPLVREEVRVINKTADELEVKEMRKAAVN